MNRRTKRLLAANNELEKELTPENERAMTDIVVYLRAANIAEYQQELVRRDITEMVLEGQRRGDTMEEVIGADYKAFCDAVLAEVPERTARQRLLSAIGNACLYVDVLAVIWLAFGTLGWLLGEGAWPWLSVTAGNLLALAVVVTGTWLMVVMEPEVSLMDALFEITSAFGTVGLSTGITTGLGVDAKLLSILVMYIGRLGPLTVASLWYFSPGERVSFPEGNVAIG